VKSETAQVEGSGEGAAATAERGETMFLQPVKVLTRSRLLAGCVQTPFMKDRVPRVRHSDILAGKDWESCSFEALRIIAGTSSDTMVGRICRSRPRVS